MNNEDKKNSKAENQKFDATETNPLIKDEINSNVDKSILDFLKNSPVTPFNYQPSPMPTPEQFNEAGKALKDAAIKHMAKIRNNSTDTAPSTDNKNKPK